MPALVTLRALTAREKDGLDSLARSRTAPARLVERAKIVQAAARGERPAAVAASQGCSRPTVYNWIRRFNDRGLPGLEERRRSGRFGQLEGQALGAPPVVLCGDHVVTHLEITGQR